MSVWLVTYQQSVFKRCRSDKYFSELLPTRWRQKSTGVDTEQNYVTVTLCIDKYLDTLLANQTARKVLPPTIAVRPCIDYVASEITVYSLIANNSLRRRVGAGTLLKLSLNSYDPYIGRAQCTTLSSYIRMFSLVAETYKKPGIFAPRRFYTDATVDP